MEKEIKIKTKDNKIIYGTLNSQNNETLAIFVHGLAGNPNEHMYYNAKKQFPKQGIDTFRFSLYSDEDDARRFTECTIEIHAQDIDRVVNEFQDKYEQIVLVGHSLGGPSILLSKQNVDAVILWDPSICEDLDQDIEPIPETNMHKVDWGIEILIGEKLIKSYKAISSDQLLNKISLPTKIIFAEDSELKEKWMKTNIKDNKRVDISVIEGASHCFNEENTEITLFAKTIEFIHEQTRE